MVDSELCLKKFTADYHFRLQPRTLNDYKRSVKQLLIFTGRSIDEITKKDIRQWLLYLTNRGYKVTAIYSKVSGLKTFFRYCYEEGICSENPAARIPHPNREIQLPFYLTKEQLAKLRQLLTNRHPMERAIFELLYATGVRIGELCAIERQDIQWAERMITIRKGKGKKERIVLFTRTCETYLRTYLEGQNNDNSYIFPSFKYTDGHISTNTVAKWFRAYSEEVGFRLTPHTLRHTFSAHLAKRGMSLEYIQALLGHVEPQQTRFYARLYNHAQKELYDEFM